MGLLNFKRVLQKALEPLNMVILPFEFKLITNQETQLLLGFYMQLIEGFMEYCINLLLYMCCLGINFFYLQVDVIEIFSELIFSPVNVRIYFLDFYSNILVCILQFE